MIRFVSTAHRSRAAGLRPVLLLLVLALAGCRHRAESVAQPGEPLRPCPGTPNCVSTEAEDRRHSIAPLPFHGTAEEAQACARTALLREPRTRLVLERPGYLRAEARSRVFRFVDDVEVVVDGAARLVRFRSASRVGHGDMGVNRARMERFGRRFCEACPAPAAARELVATPPCARPAPLGNVDHRGNPNAYVDEYLVMLREGPDPAAERERLARKHGFMVTSTFSIIPAFSAELEPGTVAALRCEPTVETVDFSKTNIPPPSSDNGP